MRKYLFTPIVAVLLGACAYQIPPPIPSLPTPDPPTTAPVDPQPVGRYAFGDSNSAMMVGTGHTAGDGRTWFAATGYTLADWMPELLAAVDDPPATIGIAEGTNDAGLWDARDPGWSAADEAAWTQAFDAINPATCVYLLLPDATVSVDQIEAARTWIAAQAAARGFVVVDPRGRFQLGADGIHGASDEAWAVREALMNEGEAGCA